MPSPQPQNILRIDSTLDLRHRAQADILAQWMERMINVPRPRNDAHDQRRDEGGHDVGAIEDEVARHKDEEDDDTPNETGEGDGPSLSMRLVGFVKH